METAISGKRAAYLEAYDAVIASWPVSVSSVDVPTAFGVTHVNVCGPASAPPLVLLAGGGCTSTVWFANVAALSEAHRVYAIDQVNEAGRGALSDTPPDTPDDMMAWLDAVLSGLGVERADVCGHSYGGWLALRYALDARDRVRKLVLLDPSMCFGGFAPRYLLHALPTIVLGRDSSPFLRWETDGATVDPAYQRLRSLPSGQKTSKIVMARRPSAASLRGLDVPTLVLLGERSKTHNIRRVGAAARELLPDVDVRVLAGQTHHTIPMLEPAGLNREIVAFCASPF